MGLTEKPGDMIDIYKLLTILSDTTIDEVDSRHTKLPGINVNKTLSWCRPYAGCSGWKMHLL